MTILTGRRGGLCRPAVLLLAGFLLSAVLSSAQQKSESRRLYLPLTGWAEGPAEAPGLDSLEVWLGDRQQQIEALRQPLDGPTAGSAAVDWQVVVYFDAPLTSPDGLRQAAQLLERSAETLTALGATEIVLADPRPRRYLEASRDDAAIREALRDLRQDALTTGDLLWHRQRYAGSLEDGGEAPIHRAWREELELLQRQRGDLLLWLSSRSPAGPRLLILVQSGFDLNPADYYAQQAPGPFLEDPRGAMSHTVLARSLAAAGWTVLSLAVGPRPEELLDPLAPLFELARATGGEVVTRRRDGQRRLAEVATWPILEVALTESAETGILPLKTIDTTTGRTVETRQWASREALPSASVASDRSLIGDAEPPPVLQLLRPDGITHTGFVRFRTITGHQRIHRVAFLLDGEDVAESRRAPYSAEIDLGTTVVPHRVEAVAYSRSNRRLGSDSLQLNIGLQPPAIEISELTYDPGRGILELSADASQPAGAAPERVEVYVNLEHRTTLLEAPYTAHLTVDPLRPEDFVRVVAHYPSGEMVEAARLPAVDGPADELDVNLVELLAMVTPRDRQGTLDLERSDFVIRQRGRALSIDHFSRWEDLQLTLGLVLDTSDSMQTVLEDAREAGERFFQEALQSGDEAFVVDFNVRPRLARRVTTDSDELLNSLVGIEAHGMTALYDAIVFSLQQFEQTAGRRALVVLTDGEDSASYYQPRECVRQARLHGVPVYLIVLGSPPDPHREPELLRNLMIARRSGGEVYYISDLDDLAGIYEQIADELRRQYSLAFDAGHTLTPQELLEIEVEVVHKGVEVRTLLASQQRGG